jgi:hypothetical protein
MRVEYHPFFAEDIKRFEAQYLRISPRLALRFRAEIDKAIDQIKESPLSAGHFVNTGKKVVTEIEDEIYVISPFSFFMALPMIFCILGR